jgi:hypothetical protein
MEERQTRRCVTRTVVSPYRDNPHLERPHVIEAPLRGSISHEAAAALPSSFPSAAAGGVAERGCGDCDAPLFFPHRLQRSSLLLQHRQWQRDARRCVSTQTTTLPSSSPSAVASGGAAARGHGDRGAPLFFPNGIGNGAPPFFPNRVLLPPLDCTPSPPSPSSGFGPVTASSGATSLPCASRSTGSGVHRV